MKSKKLLSLILIGGMILFNSLSVFADTTSGEVVETETITINGTEQMEAPIVTVSYVSSESLSVIIPKKINLDGTQTNPTTSFNVSVSGDIAGTSSIRIYSDKEINLKQDGKADVKATIDYDRTFTSDEVIANTTDNGSVSVPSENGNKLSAGAWSGDFKFYINYINGNGSGTGTENPITREAGLYKTDGSFIPWDELDSSVQRTIAISSCCTDSFVSNGYDGELVFPVYEWSYRINQSSFYGCSNLNGIDLRNSQVESIDDYAFKDCTNLENVYLSNTLTIIGSEAFKDCTNLENVYLPNTLTRIGDMAFYGCSSLTNINYSGTMEEWNNISINGSWNLTSAIVTITCSDGVIEL